MIESFVDLTYRGLSLGRRVKLTLVRPSNGYLEMPAPMPVGSRIALTTDEGVIVDAVVAEVREQTAGGERAPGMKILPALAPDVAASWWQARVTLTEEEPAPARPVVIAVPAVAPVAAPTPAAAAPKGPTTAPLPAVSSAAITPPPVASVPVSPPVIVRPRNNTLVELPEGIDGSDDVPSGLRSPSQSEQNADDEPEIRISGQSVPNLRAVSVPVAVDPRAEASSKRTVVMAAVDQDLLKQLTQQPGEIERLVERTGDHPVIDDGKRTMVMEAIDPAVFGIDPGTSGSMPVVEGDEPDDKSKPGGRKRRSKKR